MVCSVQRGGISNDSMRYQNYTPKGNSGDGSVAVCGDVRTHARQGVRRQQRAQGYESGSALDSNQYEF